MGDAEHRLCHRDAAPRYYNLADSYISAGTLMFGMSGVHLADVLPSYGVDMPGVAQRNVIVP